MLFSSLTFVWFFLPALALIYYISPGRKLKNGVLLMASLVFYSWGEPRYVVLVVLSILLNYGFGLALDGCGERKGLKKAVFVLSILVNLGLLGYFKYFNFFLELAMSLLGRQGFLPRDIALPIGISFTPSSPSLTWLIPSAGRIPPREMYSVWRCTSLCFPRYFPVPLSSIMSWNRRLGTGRRAWPCTHTVLSVLCTAW